MKRPNDRFLVAALLGMTVGCELDKTTIPRTEATLALHGVLSASASSQVVLLERIRTGRVQTYAPPFDVGDPVVSDEGIAESGAQMVLALPDGSTIAAVEDPLTRSDGKGQGIYRFFIPGASLQRNAPYRLTVRTTKNEVLSAFTSVPDGVASMAPSSGAMDRTTDTLELAWPASPTARSYFVRVETPYGPRSFFTESTHVRLPGMLRNVDVAEVPHVFLPGFTQPVTVSAVDSNYYDWYRTHNDPLTGEGLINRVTGGLGVFGSIVRVSFDSVKVSAPRNRAVEGHFTFLGTGIDALAVNYLDFDVYVESPAARSGQSDALSGNYRHKPDLNYRGCPICGLFGTARDNRVELVLLKDWSGADTVDVFDAQLQGDTLTGYYRYGGGPFQYVRQR